MQNKFLFGGLVVALAVAYPAISYFHGSKLHTEVEQRVAKINEYLHDELALKSSLEAKLEQSGIFSSQYIIAIKNEDGTEVSLLQSDIEHGPFPLSKLKAGQFAPLSYASTVTLIRNKEAEKWFTSVDQEKATNTQGQPLWLEYSVGYDQQIRGKLDFAGLKLNYSDPKTKESLEAAVGAGGLSFSVDKGFKNWYVDSYSDPVKLMFQPLGLSIDIDKGTGNIVYQSTENNSVSTVTSQIGGVTLVNHKDVDIKLGSLWSEFSASSEEKTIDLKSSSKYEDITVQGVNFGRLEEGTQYRRLDKSSAELLRQIAGKIFVDVIRNADLIAAQNSCEADATFEKILKPHIFPLSAAAISLFNQQPEVQYGPVVLTNSAGRSKFKAELGLLLPSLNAANEQEMILNAIGNLDIDVVFNENWATQILWDTATLLAKENNQPLPTEEDKKQLAKLMNDVKSALTSTQLATTEGGGEGDIRFAIQAKPAPGQSIRDTKEVIYNDKTYSVPEFLFMISERAAEAEKRLKELGVEQKLTAFMDRFNRKSVK